MGLPWISSSSPNPRGLLCPSPQVSWATSSCGALEKLCLQLGRHEAVSVEQAHGKVPRR